MFGTNLDPGTHYGNIIIGHGWPFSGSEECRKGGSFTESATLQILPAEFDVSPSSITISGGQGCRLDYETFTITNEAPCGKAFFMSDDQPWLSVNPRFICTWWGCLLGAGESGEVRVYASSSGLAPGTYTGTINVRNDSITKPVEVNLIVTPKEEVCDGIDNDCDGIVDEGCCEDKDGDGHYAISAGCPQGDDCNDGEENIYPGAPEFCDGKDNNCNRIIDEGFGCEVSIMINPSEVWPRGAGSSPVNADVIITSITPASYEGCTINLRVESVDQSGGHMHDGLRPAGRISPSTITIPSCTIGSWSATYTSSEVSGEERIIAEVDGEEVNEAMITVPNFSFQTIHYRVMD